MSTNVIDFPLELHVIVWQQACFVPLFSEWRPFWAAILDLFAQNVELP